MIIRTSMRVMSEYRPSTAYDLHIYVGKKRKDGRLFIDESCFTQYFVTLDLVSNRHFPIRLFDRLGTRGRVHPQ